MPTRVLLARVKAGSIVPDEPLRLPDGLRVTVVANPRQVIRAILDAEDPELIAALAEAEREDARQAAAAGLGPPQRRHGSA